ncbi:unnamed protein product [Linum trigynum]|uniref:Uncharacterized protein n=1 Tax=Linum trigynum TaxID=586398 RepID=A0AAV2GBA9_9ROSI
MEDSAHPPDKVHHPQPAIGSLDHQQRDDFPPLHENPVEPLHMGAVIATTFARFLGRDRVGTMHLGASSQDGAALRCGRDGMLNHWPDLAISSGDNLQYEVVLQRERGIEYLDGI